VIQRALRLPPVGFTVRSLRRLALRTAERLRPLDVPGSGAAPARAPVGAPGGALSINLAGRTALVTGASGELGRVMARTLGACGAAVAVHCFRGEERARAIVEELTSSGVRAAAFQADVASPSDVERMKSEIARQLGPPDIVVCNAVSQFHWTTVLEQPLEDFRGQVEVSLIQSVLLAKAFAPSMIERRWGRILGISTECVMQAFPNSAAYIAGKGGMDRVLRVLARELGPHGITVNQVAPGWMISERHRATGEERQPHYEKMIPLRRRGEDQDVANAVAFLASDLAAYVSGVFLPVCGGNVMPGI
jgi:3-oxoacyl-[acyl-carrier protein] reductase